MKTITPLTVAPVLLASVITSQAQVTDNPAQYIIGYVKVPLAAGYNLVANQLDVDGTGTNNSIYTSVGTQLPPNTTVLAWNGSGFSASKLTSAGKWTLNTAVVTNAVNPGYGFFVDTPVATNVTFIGNVLTATNTYNISQGYQVMSPIAPVAGGIGTALGYVPDKNDVALIWNGAGYSQHKYSGSTWTAGEPTFSAGEAVFFDAATNTSWTESLNSQ
jgi:hypothetical protein